MGIRENNIAPSSGPAGKPWATLACVGVLLSACSGSISSPGEDSSSRGSGAKSGTGSGTGGAGNTSSLPVTGPLAVSGLRRLTEQQYRNTVRDLLGQDVRVATALPADKVEDEGFEFRSVGAAHVSTSGLGVQQYDVIARDLALQIFVPSRRAAFVGCTPATADAPCVSDFLRRFGRQAWRRPLDTAEMDRYRALVAKAAGEFSDPWKGLEIATAAFLSSPFFLYRVELGVPDARDAKRLNLDAFEIATRLSYLVWDSTPDDDLLDAAENGTLSSSQGLSDQVDRLLASPRAKATMTSFFDEWLSFRDLDQLPKDQGTFPTFSKTMGAAMREEFERLTADIVFERDAAFTDLFTTRTTFVNAELAKHYGLDAPASDWQRVEHGEDGERAGLLTLAGWLAANARATMTSPTLRGLFINQRLLCREIPPPPPDAVTALPPPPADGKPETMRQRLSRHATEVGCAACHKNMDPAGLAMEHFDGIGAYRSTDQGLPIDVKGDLDGTAFDGARELGGLLAQDSRVHACVARHLAQHALGLSTPDDQDWAFRGLGAAFSADGFSFKGLLRSVASHELFRVSGGMQ